MKHFFYIINGENEAFATLAEVRHHVWLANDEQYSGRLVLRIIGDDSFIVGVLRVRRGRCNVRVSITRCLPIFCSSHD